MRKVLHKTGVRVDLETEALERYRCRAARDAERWGDPPASTRYFFSPQRRGGLH